MGGKAASSFSPLTFVMGIVCFEEEEEEVVVWSTFMEKQRMSWTALLGIA
jgi:hypothetical protein